MKDSKGSLIARELRRFRRYAKDTGLILDRAKSGEFAWDDTRNAWNAWWTRAKLELERPAGVDLPDGGHDAQA